MVSYATATEIRNYIGLSDQEKSDTILGEFANSASGVIDLHTGRTWQSQIAVTNEYYDGDGTEELDLNHVDLQSLTALAIDNDFDGTYTSVTVADVIVYKDLGKIVLNTDVYSGIEVTDFTKGNNTVKVSYTYGLTTLDTGTGTATSNTMTDLTKTWTVNRWAGYILQDVEGNTWIISSNTATAITIVGTPASGVYKILEKIPQEVKHLCILMIAQMLNPDDKKQPVIDELTKYLTWNKTSALSKK